MRRVWFTYVIYLKIQTYVKASESQLHSSSPRLSQKSQLPSLCRQCVWSESRRRRIEIMSEQDSLLI